MPSSRSDSVQFYKDLFLPVCRAKWICQIFLRGVIAMAVLVVCSAGGRVRACGGTFCELMFDRALNRYILVPSESQHPPEQPDGWVSYTRRRRRDGVFGPRPIFEYAANDVRIDVSTDTPGLSEAEVTRLCREIQLDEYSDQDPLTVIQIQSLNHTYFARLQPDWIKFAWWNIPLNILTYLAPLYLVFTIAWLARNLTPTAFRMRHVAACARARICHVCRYDLRGHADSARCPECGTGRPIIAPSAPRSLAPPPMSPA